MSSSKCTWEEVWNYWVAPTALNVSSSVVWHWFVDGTAPTLLLWRDIGHLIWLSRPYWETLLCQSIFIQFVPWKSCWRYFRNNVLCCREICNASELSSKNFLTTPSVFFFNCSYKYFGMCWCCMPDLCENVLNAVCFPSSCPGQCGGTQHSGCAFCTMRSPICFRLPFLGDASWCMDEGKKKQTKSLEF